jgi:hypothetical protein
MVLLWWTSAEKAIVHKRRAIIMTTIYNLIPKWLLAILCVILLASSAVLTVRMYYYDIEAKKAKADNMILTNNVTILTASLDTCTKSLKAEADNCARIEKVNIATQSYKKKISAICVKEGPNEKTNISDAISMSNALSDRLVYPDKGDPAQ